MSKKGLLILLVFLFAFDLAFASDDDDDEGITLDSLTGATGYQTQSDINRVCGGGPMNVKNSFILSVVTLCLPGILEKVEEWKQIKCQQVQCVYESVKNEIDPAYCYKVEAYQTCAYIAGEAFALPPMSMLEYWRSAIANLLADPIGIAYSATVMGARAYLGGSCNVASLPLWCSVMANAPVLPTAALLFVTDITAFIQTVQDIFENGFFPSSEVKDYCEGIDDIKKEMQDILNVRGQS